MIHMSGVKNQKWNKFKRKRRAIQRNIIAIRNKLNAQAVFKEDKEDVKSLDETIDFLSKLDYNYNWEYKKVCPMCESDKITKCEIEPCCFDGVNNKKLGRIEGLYIYHCEDCGYTTISNPWAGYNNEW
jgi:hypothetical protein